MKKTLFDISENLEKLSGLLDLVESDDQQEIIEQWFEQLGEERDCKLDGYAALVGSGGG